MDLELDTTSERSLRELELFLLDAQGFRMAIATYDFPVTRDEVIQSLRERLELRGLHFTTLDFRHHREERNPLRKIEQHLNSLDLQASDRLVVMIVALEVTFEYPTADKNSQKDVEALANLNIQRERFPEVCPFPIVFWLNQLAASALARFAPDFWHWRSASFLLPRARYGEPAVASSPPTKTGKWVVGDNVAEATTLPELLTFGMLAVGSLPTIPRRANKEAAIEALEKALAASRKTGFRRSEIEALTALGAALLDAGEPRQAVGYLERALDLAEGVGDPHSQARAASTLGKTLAALGDHQKARELHERALMLARGTGDRGLEGSELAELGAVLVRLGESDRARELLETSLALVRELGDRSVEATAAWHLGLLYAEAGDVERALKLMQPRVDDERQRGAPEAERHEEVLAELRRLL
ncbi:MAG: tetratricopeptide repeat protein [Thermoanaerobaculia bacterium]|nr:tetratricopeptide repeat protein [Thermoanaerobaculia bacterium]